MLWGFRNISTAYMRPEMNPNWGAELPPPASPWSTLCTFAPPVSLLHASAACQVILHQAILQRPVTTHILLRTVGRWGWEGMLATVKE